MGKTVDKLVIKIAEPQKRANIFDFCWARPVFDAGNFYQVHASHPLFKNYPQVIDTGDVKTAFGEFDKEAVLCEEVQYVMYCINMVGNGRAGTDNDVVHVDMDYGSLCGVAVNDRTENVVHHSLKGCRRVCEAKIHNHGFPNAKTGLECRFPLVSIADVDIVIPPSDVEGGKNEQVS